MGTIINMPVIKLKVSHEDSACTRLISKGGNVS